MNLDTHENSVMLEKAKELELESADIKRKESLKAGSGRSLSGSENELQDENGNKNQGKNSSSKERKEHSFEDRSDFSQRVKQRQIERNAGKKKAASQTAAKSSQDSKLATSKTQLIVKAGKETGKKVLNTAAGQFEKYDKEYSQDRDIMRASGEVPKDVQIAKSLEHSDAAPEKTLKSVATMIAETFRIISTSAVSGICIIITVVMLVTSILSFILFSDTDEQEGGGGEDIVKVALEQLGNGGTTYWSWYGFQSRQPWCACFVSWCANKCGYIKSGIIPKYALCSAGSDWFKSHKKWRGRDYAPGPGDIIFFFRGGVISHTGIVEKCENGTVYTVEGNTGGYPGTVKKHTYPKGAGEIYGYGTPAYPESSSGGGSGVGSNAIGSKAQKSIVAAATNGKWYGTGPGWCEAWVAAVYRTATGNGAGHCCAKASRDAWATTKGKIPVGAAIYSSDKYRSRVTCSCGRNAGHVGIYIGNGKVVSMLSGGPTVQSLSTWKSWFGYGGWSWRGKKIN